MKQIPEPFLVPQSNLRLDSLQQSGKRFRQFSRLTVGLSDPDFLHALLKHPGVAKFDVLAVRPLTEAILTALSSKPGVDLIALDPAEKYPWLLKGKILGQAVERGLGFELSYSPALLDSSLRRTLLAQGRQLMASLGRKVGSGLVLSSGARSPIQLRGPFDAANLVVLFGAQPSLGRAAISASAKRVLLRAETKTTVKGAVHVAQLGDAGPETLRRLAAVPEFRLQIEKVEKNDESSPEKRARMEQE